MIALWNRKEVYMGYNTDKLTKAMDILSANKIKYKFRYGNFGTLLLTNQSGSAAYLYVAKRDADAAKFLLRGLSN
jgi:hypothetical protein